MEPGLAASERLVESHLPLVRSIARRHLGMGEEFEDLVQVGSVGLMKAAGRFDPGRGVAFGAFAARVVEGEIRHHLRDRMRMGRREFAPGEQADDMDAPWAAGDGLAASVDRLSVASGVRCLSQRERRIVFLRFHADLTEREIGQEMGLSQAHVSRLLKRALERLRGELGPNRDITPDTVRRTSDQESSLVIPWVGESGKSTLSTLEADGSGDVPGKQEEAGPRSQRDYSGRFLVRIPTALHEELAHAAQGRQISLNRLVVDLLSTTVEAGDPVAVDAGEPVVVESDGAQPGPSAAGGPTQPVHAAPRWIRVALATNLVLLVLAGIAAIVVLVLALQHGV